MVPIDPRSLTREQRRKVITSKMFLKEKFLSTGEFDKLKSRLVAGGHRQDRRQYEEWEITSPTVSMASVYMISAIAAMEQRRVMTIDVGNAYLNANMSRDIFMKIDPVYSRFKDIDGSIIVKLEKALYGCVESSQLWYDNLTNKLKSLGFSPNSKDPCVLNKACRHNIQLTVAIYVDDLLCCCKEEDGLKWLAQALRDEYTDIQVNEGSLHSYLGQTFDFSQPGKVRITMEGYVQDLLTLYEVDHYAATPALSNLFTVKPDSPKLDQAASDEFHSRVAKLLYLAKRVRPDILTAVIFLSTRVKCATREDHDKLNRVLGYLNSTYDMGLILEAHTSLQIISYVDASFAVHADMRSHSGGVITLGKGAIWSKSARQKLNTKSSTEAEFVAASDLCSQVLWTREFIAEQGHKVGPAVLYQDNLSAVKLAENGASSAERTRHIAICFFWLKDRVDAGELTIVYCPTADMVADLLTKPLQGEAFRRLRRQLLNWEE